MEDRKVPKSAKKRKRKGGGHQRGGVISAMLRHALGRVTSWLVDIFKCGLSLANISISWRRVRLIFIAKAGKSDHSKPKDRPLVLA